MKVLAIDIGSSSVKAAVLSGDGVPRKIARASFPTRYEGGRAEVDTRAIEKALYDAIGQLDGLDRVDLIAPTGMAPSWLAMDKRGRAITPVVTHQDRRSLDEAQAIQKQIGAKRHLKIAGNNPVPGSISSTTYRWFNTHAKDTMRRADLVGHLNTWLLRNWCGVRAIDPSNASFTGLFNTCTLKGWNDELIAAVGARKPHLPDIFDANRIAGRVTKAAASRLGVTEGTPVLTGIMDGSCAMLLAGAEDGQMVHVMGSTDVLAVCVDRPRPCTDLLTRALGVGRWWLCVGTLAASGSAVEWMRQQLFRDRSNDAFYAMIDKIARKSFDDAEHTLHVVPTFAGMRTEVRPTRAAFYGVDLGTTREQMLEALCRGLCRQSRARMGVLGGLEITLCRDVLVSGGVQKSMAKIMHYGWNEKLRYYDAREPTLRGLWHLSQMASE